MALMVSLMCSATHTTETVNAPPVNDEIENALVLPYQLNDVVINVLFNQATLGNDGGTNGGCNISFAGVWYRFKALKSGTVTAEINDPLAPVVIWFTGPEGGATSGSDLTYVDQSGNPCGGGDAVSSITATAGTTYYLYGRNLINSTLKVNIANTVVVPSNDMIENAIEINNSTTVFVDEDIAFDAATTDDGAGLQCISNTIEFVWYKFFATEAGIASAIVSGPQNNFVTFFSAPNGTVTHVNELTYVDQPTNGCLTNNESSLINAEEGRWYYIAVNGNNGERLGTLTADVRSLVLNTQPFDEGTPLTVYPSPVKNQLYVSTQEPITAVAVYSISGQQVYNSSPANTPSVEIDFSTLNAGVYIVKLVNDKQSVIYKRVVKN